MKEIPLRDVRIHVPRADGQSQEVVLRVADLPPLAGLTSEGLEGQLREAIAQLEGSGLRHQVAVDLYRNLVLGNFARFDGVAGKAARQRLDEAYPDQGALPGFAIQGRPNASGMILNNLREHEQGDDAGYAVLGWLFEQLLAQRILSTPTFGNQPAVVQSTTVNDADREAAPAIVERLYPDPERRRAMLSLLADSIDAAVGAGAEAWSLSERDDGRLQLNVGRYRTLRLYSDKVVLSVDEPSVPEAFLDCLDAPAKGESDYEGLPEARSATLSIPEAVDSVRALWPAHLRLIERAAASARKAWKQRRKHERAVTAYMRALLVRDVPDPVSNREEGTGNPEPVSTWIFQSNPNLFDLPAALAEVEEMTWVVRQHGKDIHPGDTVYLWESGKDAGILARATVLTEPAEIAEDEDTVRFMKKGGHFAEVERRVRIRFDDVFHPRLSRAQLLAHPVLKELRILVSAQGTNFKVSDEQAHILEEYAPSAGQFDLTRSAPPLDEAASQDTPDVEVREEAEPQPLSSRAEPRPDYPLSSVAADTGFDKEMLERWVRAINRKGQAIVFGPPGTGKTFVAGKLANHLAGNGFGLVELVQFHPSYAYEDFMLGMRPRALPGGGLEYPLVSGRFVDFCDRARELEGTSVLVIDEINRANLSRVFGELMFLLEYRDETVSLAGGREFSIPKNVRLIGTMNTADRSIALVDHALRRRFAFLALEPNFDVLRRRYAGREKEVGGLITVLERLNRAIGDPHYSVGISFFLGKDLFVHIEDIWRMEIEPYIEEYFFDRRDVFEQFRWPRVGNEVRGSRREET